MDINKITEKEGFSNMLANIISGIKHGFFKCEIECETVKGKKRQITYKAGKSHKFIIEDDDLKNL